jgi:methylenetetrahydrofolate dehydrogenase (NADP+)/methenyltetrahydrofolate cyclohydrolase
MTASILDGIKISAQIRGEIKDKIDKRSKAQPFRYGALLIRPAPVLAMVLCTDDPASEIYVRRKREACEEVGITSYVLKPFEGGVSRWSNPMGHLLSTIDYLNNDKSINGILVQLPLPDKIDARRVFDAIDPGKDVDVLSPTNLGLLLQGRPRFVPCTPAGVQEILTRSGVTISGKKVCIINRSEIVGKPLHALLIQNNERANATVTLCHDHTPPARLKEVCLSSDIIVVAVGKPGFLTADMVATGSVVVDVGINRVPDSNKIVGDVDFESVSKNASWISPVPGGIGPLTVCMLMRNTLQAQIEQAG